MDVKMAKVEANASDEAVVGRVLAGDAASFGVLVDRYNRQLFRVSRGILRDRSAAEDAVQQAYLQAYTHLHQFAGQAAFSTWLCRIAIRESVAMAKKMRRQLPVDDEVLADLASPDATPEDLQARRQAARHVEAAVDALPIRYRTVFVMREVQGMSTAETAESLGLSADAVKVRLHRAKDRLRARLEEHYDPRGAFDFLGGDCQRLYERVMRAVSELSRARS
jgi:RNA polymerase sigma-70 factor (ECF subfamily)